MKKQRDESDTLPTCTQLRYACEDLSAYLCTEFSLAFSAVQNKSKLVTVTLHVPLRQLLLDEGAPLQKAHGRVWALGLACSDTPHLLSLSLWHSCDSGFSAAFLKHHALEICKRKTHAVNFFCITQSMFALVKKTLTPF